MQESVEPTLENLETFADTWGFTYTFTRIPGKGVRLKVWDAASWPGLEVHR